jgi:hypothetical protein
MRADVTKYVLTCDPCQKIKHDQGAKSGFLQPLSIPATPFDTIMLDFVTGLPNSQGKDTILVVIDKLTKFALFFATNTDVTATETTSLLLQVVWICVALVMWTRTEIQTGSKGTGLNL